MAIPRATLVALAQGMQRDLQAYAQLRGLLQQQFHAALRHDASAMERLALAISAQADALALSRDARVTQVHAILPAGQPLSVAAVFALLPLSLRQQLEQLWRQLEALVHECKALNVRNGALMLEQSQLMRQVLGVPAQEEGIYGPR